MKSNVSCRLPESLSEQVDAVVEQSGTLRSEVIRRAIQCYVKRNPDGLPALEDPETPNQDGEKTRNQTDTSIYDPSREF